MSAHRLPTAALGVTLLVLAGCSTSPDPAPSPPVVTTPSASTPTTVPPPNPTASASAAAIAAYLGFQTALTAAQRTADPHNRDLAKYSADKALSAARVGLIQQQQAGVIFKGKPVFNPVVGRIDLTGEGYIAITDCVDNTHWVPVYKATGKSAAAPGQHPRIPGSATLFRYGGHWVVRTVSADRSRTC